MTDAEIDLICENLRNLWMTFIGKVSCVSWSPLSKPSTDNNREIPSAAFGRNQEKGKKSSPEIATCKFLPLLSL
jgi:hypothetical protein